MCCSGTLRKMMSGFHIYRVSGRNISSMKGQPLFWHGDIFVRPRDFSREFS
jgi:hypothetical protein